MPLSNFVPRGFGFIHHSIAILYHQVPNPNITIRNFVVAAGRRPLRLPHGPGGRRRAVDREPLRQVGPRRVPGRGGPAPVSEGRRRVIRTVRGRVFDPLSSEKQRLG